MRVLLTSAGLETVEIQKYFMDMIGKDMAFVKVLFIPTAAQDADAIAVLPKCMNDLLRCGIPAENISVFDLHRGMSIEELQQYDIVYLCGGRTSYLLQKINDTGFGKVLMEYIHGNGVVIGVSAGSVIFANNLPGNLALIDTKLSVHCAESEKSGKIDMYQLVHNIRLTNTCALAIRDYPDGLEIIGKSLRNEE